MLHTSKVLPLLVLLIVVFSSAYAFISSVNYIDIETQNTVSADNQATDTTQNFPLKKYAQDTYEELNTVYPLDTKQPENIKSVVEYDPNTGNYISEPMPEIWK